MAGYFTARCSESYTECWGINLQVTDRNNKGSLTGIVMYGEEDDVDVVNADTAVLRRIIISAASWISFPQEV